MPAEIKNIKCMLSISIVLLTLLSYIPVSALTIASRQIVFSEYIKTLKNQTPSETNKKLLRLSQFAADSAGLEGATYQGSPNFYGILYDVDKQILSRWPLKINPKNVERISKNKSRLRSLLGPKSISWAWSLRQLGDVEKAKAILTSIFEIEHKRVLRMKKIWVNRSRTKSDGEIGNSILSKSKSLVQALETMSTEEEKKLMKSKFRKMKLHLSNLPTMTSMG